MKTLSLANIPRETPKAAKRTKNKATILKLSRKNGRKALENVKNLRFGTEGA